MKKTILLFIYIFLSISFFNTISAQEETTTYYLIRHAEKDRSNPENRDPSLTQDGLSRAMKWAEVFKNVKFDDIYSTDYKRTKQTAAPTAIKRNKEIVLYDPRDFDIEAFKEKTKGKTILIVGHSNTTPAMVNRFLGVEKYAQIDDKNNANLYIVSIIGNKISSELLYIN